MPVVEQNVILRYNMAIMECMHCHVTYAMTQQFYNSRCEDEESFFLSERL